VSAAPTEGTPTPCSRLSTEDPDEEPDQQDRRQKAQHERRPHRPALIGRLGVDHHVLVGEQPGQLGRVDERGDFGLEPGDSDRVSVTRRVEGRLAPQLALDGVRPRADLLDIAGLHLIDKERLVGNAPRSSGRPVMNENPRFSARSASANQMNSLPRGIMGRLDSAGAPRPSGAGSTRQPSFVCSAGEVSGGDSGARPLTVAQPGSSRSLPIEVPSSVSMTSAAGGRARPAAGRTAGSRGRRRWRSKPRVRLDAGATPRGDQPSTARAASRCSSSRVSSLAIAADALP
jgi:hypothetical protein